MAERRAHQEPGSSAPRSPAPSAERLVQATERVWFHDGDLALNVRRLLGEAKVANRDLYLAFGSRDSLLAHVAEALADHVQRWADVSTGSHYVTVALERPAAWRALVLGHGPVGLPTGTDRFTPIRALIADSVGGDAELAKLDGVISAVIAGRLDSASWSERTAGEAEDAGT